MRAIPYVGAAIFVSILGGPAHSQGGPSGLLNVHRVTANLYWLDNEASGGNVAVLVGNDGVLLVDAHGSADAQALLATVKTISDSPIRFVIDTHCHTDHTAGNAALQRAGATVVAQDTLRRRLEAKKCDNDVALPTLTFDRELTLHFDDEEVRAIALPKGHTDGDAIVYFTKANVVAVGDAFVSSEHPFYSKYAGGNMLGVNEQLRRIVALFPDDVKIITGHGPLSSRSDVRRVLETLDGMRDAIVPQVAKGKTFAELQEMHLLDPWKNVLPDDARAMYLRFYYDSLGPPDPKFEL